MEALGLAQVFPTCRTPSGLTGVLPPSHLRTWMSLMLTMQPVSSQGPDPRRGVWSQDCALHDLPEETQILVLQPFCALARIRTQACTTLFILARTLALSRPHVGTEHTCVGRQKSRQHL